MASGMSWFRFWNQAIHHPKIAQLHDDDFRVLVTMWCLASQSSEPGVIKKADDAVIEALSHIDNGGAPPGFVVGEAIQRFVSIGLVTRANGHIEVHDWNEWQRRGDNTSAERSKRYRDRRVTSRHGIEEKRREEKRKEKKKSQSGQPEIVECPERLKGLEAILKESRFLNQPALFDWLWWDQIGKIFQHKNLNYPEQLYRLEEYCMAHPAWFKATRDWKRRVKNWFSNAI